MNSPTSVTPLAPATAGTGRPNAVRTLLRLLTPARILEALLLGLIVVCLGFVVSWFPVQEKPRTPIELTPFLPRTSTETVVALRPSSMKSQSIVLPYPGTLTVEAASTRGEPFSFYLINVQSDGLPTQGKEFSLVPEFTAEGVVSYRRESRIAPGVYLITLINSSVKSGLPDPTLRIHARLDP
jgi:hypothetical protein